MYFLFFLCFHVCAESALSVLRRSVERRQSNIKYGYIPSWKTWTILSGDGPHVLSVPWWSGTVPHQLVSPGTSVGSVQEPAWVSLYHSPKTESSGVACQGHPYQPGVCEPGRGKAVSTIKWWCFPHGQCMMDMWGCAVPPQGFWKTKGHQGHHCSTSSTAA